MADLRLEKGFNAEDLYQYLARLTPEARVARPLFVQTDGGLRTLDEVLDFRRPFLGAEIPCLVLVPEEDLAKKTG